MRIGLSRYLNARFLWLLSCTYGAPCSVRIPKPWVNHHTSVVMHRPYDRNSHGGENDGLRKRGMLSCIGVQQHYAAMYGLSHGLQVIVVMTVST